MLSMLGEFCKAGSMLLVDMQLHFGAASGAKVNSTPSIEVSPKPTGNNLGL